MIDKNRNNLKSLPIVRRFEFAFSKWEKYQTTTDPWQALQNLPSD